MQPKYPNQNDQTPETVFDEDVRVISDRFKEPAPLPRPRATDRAV